MLGKLLPAPRPRERVHAGLRYVVSTDRPGEHALSRRGRMATGAAIAVVAASVVALLVLTVL
jgi:hypothetical protein